MDIEKISHRGYKVSVVVAIVLSGLLVTFAALIGRGTLNLAGSLVLPEATPLTVIALMQEKLKSGVTIDNVELLRIEKEESETGKPDSTYLVKTSDDAQYFIRISWEEGKWSLRNYEPLHGNSVTGDADTVGEGMEKQEQQ